MSDLHGRAPAWLDRIVFVLVRPSHPGNVGAVARAMKTMGIGQLLIVEPDDPEVCFSREARGRASGAVELLQAARVHASLADALAGVHLAVAVSADAREFGPVPQPPEPVALAVRTSLLAEPQARVAFVFGPERTGLSIEDAQRCQAMCSIPGSPDYHSLNLSQAAQIVAYCLRAIDRLFPAGASSMPSPDLSPDASPPSSLVAVEGFFSHLEAALLRIGFLDPSRPRKLMPRLRRLFNRARLEDEEVAILRGVCTRIIRLADQRDGVANPAGPDEAPLSPPR